MNRDHLPQLARIGSWMTRIGGAGIMFLIAGCCGLSSMIGLIIPDDADDATRQAWVDIVGTGLGVLFVGMVVTLFVGLGLKVLAGEQNQP